MKIRTRITPDGIIQERIFSTPTEPGPPASVSIEIPGYTQAGDEIGTGDGIDVSGNSVSEEDVALLEAYAGTAALASSVGKVTIDLFSYSETGTVEAYAGSYITIHDVGNGNASRTIELVLLPGDPATIPGAYTISVGGGKDLEQLCSEIAAAINTGDAIFAPKAWSLAASVIPVSPPYYMKIEVRYTGEGGASGGAPAVDDSMNVLFEDALTYPASIFYFDKYSLQDTTIDGRLSLVDPGDGCIIVPLTTVAGGTWNARYPIHPNGVTVTAMSLYTPFDWSANKVLLNVKKLDSSGDMIQADTAAFFYEAGYPGFNAGDHGFVLRASGFSPINAGGISTVNLNVVTENAVLSGNPPPSIYVEITATPGTTGPAADAAKLYIHYRVNS